MAMQEQQNNQVEFDSRIVDIRRTTKVVKGGRDFSFAAVAVVGDGEGTVGFGRGKAKEVTTAIQKATDAARRNMNRINLRGETLQHPIVATHGATKVIMRPGAKGSGIIAGGAMRDIFEVLGVHNVSAKIIGSANPTNVIRATMNGLLSMVSPVDIAEKRGKTVEEILGKTDGE
jgi:small subunit ribosomal protein S5